MPQMVIGARVSDDDDDSTPVTRLPEEHSLGERVASFEQFVERHSRELGRLAYLMLGDRDAADDLTGDALLAAWRQWDTVRTSDRPLAYMRRVVVNMATSRIRRLTRERRRLVLFHQDATEVVPGTDSAAVVDVRAALLRLPPRRRACVVLRYAFDVPEQEVARMLGITVGTVKSQTSKGVDQFRRDLGPAFGHQPWDAPDGGTGQRGARRGRGDGHAG